MTALALALASLQLASAPSASSPTVSPAPLSRSARTLHFAAGGLVGLAVHESAHVFFDVAFDADPGMKRVSFHGIPFFAITHRPGLPRREELVISSAGFWSQHATSEWWLTRHPRLRSESAPFAKGLLAFHVFTSAGYAAAAFARTGPIERDTHGMATALGVSEPWVGAMVLAPAAFDVVRYFRPESRWARWSSRGSKLMFLLLVLK